MTFPAPLQPILWHLYLKGLKIIVVPGDDATLGLPDWLRAIQGGPACYIRHLKELRMTEAVAMGTDVRYGHFRGDIHELGHAFWFLLLTTQQRWFEYAKLYGWGKLFRRLIPYGGAPPSVEESFAQDFEAYWTESDTADYAGWGWQEFRAEAPTRFAWMRDLIRRFAP